MASQRFEWSEYGMKRDEVEVSMPTYVMIARGDSLQFSLSFEMKPPPFALTASWDQWQQNLYHSFTFEMFSSSSIECAEWVAWVDVVYEKLPRTEKEIAFQRSHRNSKICVAHEPSEIERRKKSKTEHRKSLMVDCWRRAFRHRMKCTVNHNY